MQFSVYFIYVLDERKSRSTFSIILYVLGSRREMSLGQSRQSVFIFAALFILESRVHAKCDFKLRQNERNWNEIRE